MRVVLDTNIWISSLLLPQSVPGRIITAWKQATFGVVISPFILEEIRRVLEYPKIKKRLKISAEEIEEYLAFIRFFTEIIDHESNPHSSYDIRDKNDIPILATLITSQANYLVTGDRDLLVLSEEYPIITPFAFVELL